MKTTSLLCAFLLSFTLSAIAQDGKIYVSNMPASGDRPAAFAPVGWKVEDTVKGDLSGDGKPDYAIKLVEDKPVKQDEPSDSERALVVAFSDGANLKRIAVATKLLQCTSCGGAFYGVMPAPADVSIEKGVLVIENEHGSRDVSRSTFRFRYDPGSGSFVLIGYDYTDNDRLTGAVTTESTNYLTGSRVTTLSKGKRTTTKRSKVSGSKIRLEDASGDDIEGAALHRLGLD